MTTKLHDKRGTTTESNQKDKSLTDYNKNQGENNEF
jgi:hypothetical protein